MKEIPALDVSCCIHLELLICWQDDGRVEITKEGHVNFFGVRLVQSASAGVSTFVCRAGAVSSRSLNERFPNKIAADKIREKYRLILVTNCYGSDAFESAAAISRPLGPLAFKTNST